jgi:hypothetical protein
VAEGGGLLNRYRVVKPYRGFESLRLRQALRSAIEIQPLNEVVGFAALYPAPCPTAALFPRGLQTNIKI